jgi:hypothetical protein
VGSQIILSYLKTAPEAIKYHKRKGIKL